MHRAWSASALLFSLSILAAGCGGKVVVDRPDTGTGGSGGAGGDATGGTGGAPTGCVSDAECGAATICKQPSCLEGKCVSTLAPAGTPCEDGLFCTTNDTCESGICLGGAPLACPTFGPCTIGYCDEGFAACAEMPANEGFNCDPTDSCITGSTCQKGVCAGGKEEDCSFLNSPCAVGKCQPGLGCTAILLPDGQPCDDGLFCTTGDTCLGGKCTGPATPCPSVSPCQVASCDEGAKSCFANVLPDGTPCDDGNACTSADHCAAGACVGTPGVPGGVVFFSEDFHDNSKGWQLDPEWQIGPTMMSSGGTFGSDPAQDHTPTADNGVAGVVLGGNAKPVPHPYAYLTSPPFNAAAAPGPVIFSFYRWLNADYDPFMHSTVDVWNGAQWVNVFKTGGPPQVQDLAWTPMTFDVTAYKNVAMRVRFGFDIAQTGVFTVGSWNVDDVLVASATCP